MSLESAFRRTGETHKKNLNGLRAFFWCTVCERQVQTILVRRRELFLTLSDSYRSRREEKERQNPGREGENPDIRPRRREGGE